MRYFEIIQEKKSKPEATLKTDAVSLDHPCTVQIAPGAGKVRLRVKGRKAYIVNDGSTIWCPVSKS